MYAAPLSCVQARAVEVEDFDTAAALDGEMEVLRDHEAAASAGLGQCEAELETVTQQRQQLAELQASLLERLGAFFASLQTQRRKEAAAAVAAAKEVSSSELMHRSQHMEQLAACLALACYRAWVKETAQVSYGRPSTTWCTVRSGKSGVTA